MYLRFSAPLPGSGSRVEGLQLRPERAKKLLVEADFGTTRETNWSMQQVIESAYALTNAGNESREAMGAQIKRRLKQNCYLVGWTFNPIAFSTLT